MTWVQSLRIPIAEALSNFPPDVPYASFAVGEAYYVISRATLENMLHMQLGHLPLLSVALPHEMSVLATRLYEEQLVRNVAHHLTDYFPNYFVAAIYELQSLFHQYRYEAYIIGGITRDMMLSVERRFEIQDVDITLEGNAIAAAEYVAAHSKNFTLVETYPEFGTAKLNYRGQVDMDFASTRLEVYDASASLPRVVQTGVPIAADVIRRDFTVNALALSISQPGQVVDCATGLADLDSRQLRLMKPESFFEDPSRIVRALKFATRHGFSWSEDTIYLFERFLENLPASYKGGGERMRAELQSWWDEPNVYQDSQWLSLFIRQNLHRLWDTQSQDKLDLPMDFEVFIHRLRNLAEVWQENDIHIPQWEVVLTTLMLGLPVEHAHTAAQRLGLARPQLNSLEQAQRLLSENQVCLARLHTKASQVYQCFHGLTDVAATVGVLLSASFEESLTAFVRYKTQLESIQHETTGDDILKLGVAPGEAVGQLLKQVHLARVDGVVKNHVEELQWLRQQLDVLSPQDIGKG